MNAARDSRSKLKDKWDQRVASIGRQRLAQASIIQDLLRPQIGKRVDSRPSHDHLAVDVHAHRYAIASHPNWLLCPHSRFSCLLTWQNFTPRVSQSESLVHSQGPARARHNSTSPSTISIPTRTGLHAPPSLGLKRSAVTSENVHEMVIIPGITG